MTLSITSPALHIVSVVLNVHFEFCIADRALDAKHFLVDNQCQVNFQSAYKSSLRNSLLSKCYSSSPGPLRSWLFFQSLFETPSLLPSTYANRSGHDAFSWSVDHSLPQILSSLDLRVFCQIYLLSSICPLLSKANTIKHGHIVPGKLFYQSVKFASAVIYWIILSVCPLDDLFSPLSVEDTIKALSQLSSSSFSSSSSSSSPLSISSQNFQSVSASAFVLSFAFKQIPSHFCETLHIKESTSELISALAQPGPLSLNIVQFISDLGLPTSWVAAHWHEQRSVAFVGPAVMALAASFAEAIASSSAPSSSSCSSSNLQFVLHLPEVMFDDAASIASFLRSRSPCKSLEEALEEVSCPLHSVISDIFGPVDVAFHEWIPPILKRFQDFVGPTRIDIGTKVLLLRLSPWIRNELLPHARELNKRLRDRLSCIV